MFFIGNSMQKNNRGDEEIDGTIILKCTSGKDCSNPQKFFGEPAHSIITAEYLFCLRKTLYNGVLINMTMNDTLTDARNRGDLLKLCVVMCVGTVSCNA
jgi:hypothetical protein